jgi:hypothetical protein
VQFYVLRNNEQFGPIALLELREHLKNGDFAYTDLAWREGLADWAPLKDLVGGALPDATPHAVSPSGLEVAPVPTRAPTGLRWATAVVMFAILFALIAVAAWLVASFICAVVVAAQMALGSHAQAQGAGVYVTAGEAASSTYFWIFAGGAAIFSLILSPVVAWTMSFSNFFPWCRER